VSRSSRASRAALFTSFIRISVVDYSRLSINICRPTPAVARVRPTEEGLFLLLLPLGSILSLDDRSRRSRIISPSRLRDDYKEAREISGVTRGR